MKSDIKVEGSGKMKCKSMRKVGESAIIKKKMLKNNYRKIGKKKDNDVDVDVVQREHSNIKRYA